MPQVQPPSLPLPSRPVPLTAMTDHTPTPFQAWLNAEWAASRAPNIEESRRAFEAGLAEANRAIAKAETERDKLHRRMEAMFPLFQEARDALTAIPLASAKLRGIDLSLGDRMDDVGIPERWNAREERKALEAK